MENYEPISTIDLSVHNRQMLEKMKMNWDKVIWASIAASERISRTQKPKGDMSGDSESEVNSESSDEERSDSAMKYLDKTDVLEICLKSRSVSDSQVMT